MSYKMRSGQEWVDELMGISGEEAQSQAFGDLSAYLYVIAYNHLRRRQNEIARLQNLHPSEIEQLAEDFLQDTLLKLTENEYTRLKQFRGVGSFTTWAAQVITRQIHDALRRQSWHKCSLVTEHLIRYQHDALSSTPERQALSSLLMDQIGVYLNQLTPNCRSAFIRCVVNGESKSLVAEELGLTTNAVYIHLSRSKHFLRDKLRCDGFTPSYWQD